MIIKITIQLAIYVVFVTILLAKLLLTAQEQEQERKHITYIGHGVFFNAAGQQIAVAQEFMSSTRMWCRENMLATLSKKKKGEFSNLEKSCRRKIKMSGFNSPTLMVILVSNQKEGSQRWN